MMGAHPPLRRAGAQSWSCARDSSKELTQGPSEKAVTTQIAELALKGHAVHHLVSGGFVVCKYGMAKHCADFAELQAFAKKLGVTP